ncbi:alkyl hydroperoxide reductase [Flavobacterium suaedae]|uniref:Alkyl hydroperoxide reductase n=1 Tax=Flavobacterium suaedae TaxID=1767027 RepID=A0ABQ1JKB0_9FLAO|nr:TlpA disulfide reductase family protein [Flavobacterium suaedae]GGB68632.1 alkyl hydroperoxide reductase [Flavobacterium suaedae]
MKKLLLLPIILLAFTGCKDKSDKSQEEEKVQPTSFTEKALNETMQTPDGATMDFRTVLEKYQGRPIVIDLWASWCPDCIKGMPKLHALQEQFPDVTYLFLSFDKTKEAWINGIDKYEVKGEHYLLGRDKWKGGALSEAVELDWIPRYMVLDETGNIALFRAVEADDEKLIATLNNLK